MAHVIRPFRKHRPTEIIAAPKVYAFDTGFVCCFRGWDRLRTDDLGLLWEHLVLNELQARLGRNAVRYWRDKHGHEVKGMLAQRDRPPVAIECKWSSAAFAINGLRSFRRRYPQADNCMVCHDVDRLYSRRFGQITVTFLPARFPRKRAPAVVPSHAGFGRGAFSGELTTLMPYIWQKASTSRRWLP